MIRTIDLRSAPFTILVSDHHRDSADSLAEVLRLEGHRVEVAYSPPQALASCGDNSFDLALLDVQSFRAVKAAYPLQPAYMMTGHSIAQLLGEAAKRKQPLEVERGDGDPARLLDAILDMGPDGILLLASKEPGLGPRMMELAEGSKRRCIIAQDAAKALDRTARGDLDVMILDNSIPLSTAIDIYLSVRESSHPVPTIVISAFCDQSEEQREALACVEATGVLHKPFDLAMLLAKLETLANPWSRQKAA